MPTAVVAGIALVGAGIWPAIASDGSPDLPEVTAEELLTEVAASDTAQLSGTVRVDMGSGLGIPELPNLDGMISGFLGDAGGPVEALAGLASGDSTLRVAMDGPERQRVALVNGSEEFAVIHSGDELWAYDSGSNTVYRAEAPDGMDREAQGGLEDALGGLTPQQAAERFLEAAGEHADISVGGTARVAGRDAYELRVEPTGTGEAADGLGGQVTEVRVAVDAETGVPLAVTAQGEEGRLVDVSFSQITYEQPSGGTFDFTPPQDAEVHDLDLGAPLGGLLSEVLPDESAS
ncbi:LolA family protein [Streptomyces sp. 6N223]|uniref:LolA family protein n=1 Tax=Streptomyces sp. 6N223 TaxID=3457412 RepID=UPI003FD34AF9